MEISSRFISEVEKQLHRRRHLLLYGNIYDQFLWRGEYVTVDDFLTRYFRDLGFDIIAQYDLVDGFRFADFNVLPTPPDPRRKMPPRMEERFQLLVRRGVFELFPQTAPTPQNGAPAPAQVDPLSPPGRAIPGAVSPAAGPPQQQVPRSADPKVQAHVPRRMAPDEAFASIRTVLSQPHVPVAAMLNLADMLTGDSAHYQATERPTIATLMKCLTEAAVIAQGPLRGFRNTLVIKAADLTRVPDWIYRGNPFVSLIQAGRPDREERKTYAMMFLRPSEQSSGFYGGEDLTTLRIDQNEPGPCDLNATAEEFADLSDGMQAMELEALRITSWKEHIAPKPQETWRLIDYYKFGVRDDPWGSLSPERVREAGETLKRRVIGQPSAIDAVTNMLTSARVGLSISGTGNRSARPRGLFFFVGPTGVGKTELAKAVAELVFGDERAFARFDMSEFTEEHAAEKLAGAPPGYEGYEAGGQLTNRVLEHPYSILLFDEIEKAHPRVLDKFLQILEDGRLTDGKGQTAYFNQTAIIFTSNLGSSDLTDPQLGSIIRNGIMNQVRREGFDKFAYKDVVEHFQTEVEWFFTSRIGRAELLNRFGDSIVVFDLLRPDYIDRIAEKFLRLLAEGAEEKYRLTLDFDPSVVRTVHSRMNEGNNMLFGGRRIKTLLETAVERPLNRWLFENFSDMQAVAGKTVVLRLPDSGRLEAELR